MLPWPLPPTLEAAEDQESSYVTLVGFSQFSFLLVYELPQSLLIPTHKTKEVIKKSKHFTFFSFYQLSDLPPLLLPLLNLSYNCVKCSMLLLFLKLDSFNFYPNNPI